MEPLTVAGVFKDKRVLVTGITGFKGNWLAHMLHQMGADIYGYSLPPSHDAVMPTDVLLLISKVELGDIVDLGHLSSFIDQVKPEVIIHLAAQPLVRLAYEKPAETITTNITGTLNILELARLCPSLECLLVVTSDKCYANVEQIWGYRECDPMGGRDPYSASKGCCELLFNAYLESYYRGKIKAATARAGNVIGGGDLASDRIIPDMIREFRKQKPVVLRNPGATRPWQHVLDVVFGYLLLIAKLLEGTVESGAYNFGPDHGHTATVYNLARAFSEKLGMGVTTLGDEQDSPHEAQLLHLDSSKSRVMLGWEPKMDLAKTIEATATWYRGYLSGLTPLELTSWQVRTYLGLSSPLQ